MNESENDSEMISPYYSYRAAYPDVYQVKEGLKVRKFERDYKSTLEYDFVKSYPLAITSMPVSYEASSLLKCSVQMTYIRYVLRNNSGKITVGGGGSGYDPFQQAQYNAGGFLSSVAANLAGSAVNKLTGSSALGRMGAGLAGKAVQNLF